MNLAIEQSKLIDEMSNEIIRLTKLKEEAEEKYIQTFDQLEKTDIELQNHKHWLKVAGEEINEMKKELKPLRELVSLWAVR